MLGTFGEVFLPEAFFAGALYKVSNFEIIFKIIFFIGHGWHPFFASIFFHRIKFIFFRVFCVFRGEIVFLKTLDIQPFWQMPSLLVPEWDKTPP